ncbi:acyl-CoA/acyl-ACP dehydrogenase [bacterium]|nr:acyl-CoA/acyl-ACP dehydrogenase [bacterium]
MSTLPGDDLRQVMWSFADRFELHMLVQAVRSVARGPVAHLVANGARNSHEWTPEKNELLKAFDESGITAAFMDTEYGGYIDGPKNLVLALIAFELAWVDAGAATGSLAGNLGLSPIHECGTPEQRSEYLNRCIPPQPGEDRKAERAAFALTEPLPYVGVDTGVLSGKVRIDKWEDGAEPMLHVEKRGRFITNMDFANIVTAAVDSDDERIKGSCMVILEEGDEGTFDRGAPTLKMVHQLSSTRDPMFNMKVPASRIIGGYEIKDGVIVPNLNHSQVIESVFKRTRVTVGLMTAAKLLSAIEPVMRYQRQRFRGGSSGQPGSPRYELGIQMKEDALHRLVDVWATGEAAAALGFEAARVFDEFDPIEREKEAYFKENGIEGRRAVMKELKAAEKKALEYLEACDKGDAAPAEPDLMTRYSLTEAVANVLCPGTKLWNTGHGARVLREAISLMGGYGITEDCPGFLFQKWMDSQLEATYEGPEAVQRRQLSVTMLSPVFIAQFKRWTRDMRRISAARPGTGACTLASAMDMWLWTLDHLQTAKDADGNKLYHGSRQGVTFPLADALCWLLAARQLVLDTMKVEDQGGMNPVLAEGLEGIVNFYQDLCHVQCGAAAGEVGRICAELIHGYNRHPAWDDQGHCCFTDSEVEAIGAVVPGFGGGAGIDDVEGDDGSHPMKAGPCVTCNRDIRPFLRLRVKLDGCLTGCRLAKDNAAHALTQIMIPEALDYPL